MTHTEAREELKEVEDLLTDEDESGHLLILNSHPDLIELAERQRDRLRDFVYRGVGL